MTAEFLTVRTIGGLLPPDVLARVLAGDSDLGGLRPADYHLAPGETPREAANRAWSYLTGVWASYKTAIDRLPEGDAAVGLTRSAWLLVLLRELGYGQVLTTGPGGLEVDGTSYPVSHIWDASPMHLLGWGVDLDKRSKGVPGAAGRAPHAMLQELLNRSDDKLWGIVSNGRVLRLLRDSTSLSGQAFVEFDLEAMFDGEVFSDFVLLFLLAHQSRVEVPEGAVAADCWLEKWRNAATESGTRALGLLRDGVKQALEELGTGFLAANPAANAALADGSLRLDDLHRALLRLVYRLLFLFVVEDRDALLVRDSHATTARHRYLTYFSTQRLRRLARTRRGTQHADLWQSLKVVIEALGKESGEPSLALPGIGGLFDAGEHDVVMAWELPNSSLLAAVRSLSVVQPRGYPRRVVDYRNLGAEELGSIYESLLELVPRHDAVMRSFALVDLAGNDRKTSGSYYTPSALIDLVLDEALDPILDEAEQADDAEAALLAVTVCDPACGSGHFLVAAARRLATRLAAVRSREIDPTPTAIQDAMHDVVGRCIYGVDLNPMAADLAKVSLWLESMTPGRPLSFLDAHLKVGNALLGTTPALLAAGIPDAAYTVIEGDDKKTAASWKQANRLQRDAAEAAQEELFATSTLDVGNAALRRGIEDVDIAARDALSLTDLHLARTRYRELQNSPEARRSRLLADAWCAAFVAPKNPGATPITHDTLTALATEDLGFALDVSALDGPDAVATETQPLVIQLAAQYRFFHWHLEFPDIFRVPNEGPASDTTTGWHGGFTAMVGNPPWETVQMSEKEFFASREPEIANAPTAAKRKKLIEALRDSHPALHQEFLSESRRGEGENSLVRGSGRFPLTARGKISTDTIFAEHFRACIEYSGRMGIVTPTGIATGATTADFFADSLRSARLAAFYDFDNEAKIFAGVHHAYRFAVTCMTGGKRVDGARLAFVVRHVADVPSRRFELTAQEILQLNPNTGTLPVFRSRLDAEINLGIYRRHPVLALEGDAAGDPWGLSFSQGLFNMASDSGLFCTEDDLRALGAEFDGWAWSDGVTSWLPLYEAKLLSHYDHRFSTYSDATQAQLNVGSLPRVTDAQHDDPACEALVRYWVAKMEVDRALDGKSDKQWLLGWRDITNAGNERTFVPGVLPRAGVNHKFPLAFSSADSIVLQAIWSSLVFDYVARQKLSGTGMTYFILKQLAAPTPSSMAEIPAWLNGTLADWIRPRVLELVYTSHRIAGFASDYMAVDNGMTAPPPDPGPPFRWLPERREAIRAELDAAMFHVYGLSRDEVEHVLDSFFVVRKYEERDHGEFRTKRLILDRYDSMAEAAARRVADSSDLGYKSLIHPPPGQGPRHSATKP